MAEALLGGELQSVVDGITNRLDYGSRSERLNRAALVCGGGIGAERIDRGIQLPDDGEPCALRSRIGSAPDETAKQFALEREVPGLDIGVAVVGCVQIGRAELREGC